MRMILSLGTIIIFQFFATHVLSFSESKAESFDYYSCDTTVEWIVLSEFYDALNGDNWLSSSGWKQDCDVCNWEGITCTSDSLIRFIDLRSYNLSGFIPESIAGLNSLERLILHGNSITGEIPVGVTQMSNLIHLQLQNNQITGPIPTNIGNLSQLQFLYLHNNELTGPIPNSIGDLSNGRNVYLHNNELTGTLPSELSNLTGLNRLFLQNNQFESCIPTVLTSLCDDVDVRLSGNSCLSHGSSWEEFCVSPACQPAVDSLLLVEFYNALGGENWTNSDGWLEDCNICDWAGITCTTTGRVRYIDLRSNNLIGTIPNSISGFTQLERLIIHSNLISGVMPAQLTELSALQHLQLQNNQLSGSIPENIGDLTDLQYLYLNNNQLSGSIPSSIGDLNNGINIYLNNNSLSGTLPLNLANLTGLNRLFLQDNLFTGCIPEDMATLCDNVDVRLLGNTCLSHNANWTEFCASPVCEPAIDSLVLVELYDALGGESWNSATGWKEDCNICNWEGITCTTTGRVRYIDLRSNNLIGQIPSSISSMSELERLIIHSNSISGTIPSSITQLNKLKHLQLHNNQLQGMIPNDIGNLFELEYLYLHNNQLTGALPISLGNLTNAINIYVQNNGLSGSIPESLSNLTNLNRLFLQNNSLEGCIPVALSALCGTVDVRIQDNSCLSHNSDWAEFCSSPVCEPAIDSILLVEFYDALDGDNWLSSTGWKEDCNICNWEGITCTATGRVRFIDLRSYNLSGNLPSSIAGMTELERLIIHGNSISGTIPTSITQLSKLKHLQLQNNQIEGSIPVDIGDLSELQYLYLQNNQLTGALPLSLGEIDNGVNIYLQNNDFTGSLPSTLSNLISLNRLFLQDNQLEGCIPLELTSLCESVDVRIQGNACLSHNAIWEEFCVSPGCEPAVDSLLLVEFYNALGGQNWTNSDGWLEDCNICDWAGITCTTTGRVRYIDLRDNNLVGSIPNSIAGFTELERLIIHTNSISGSIPEEITELSNLKHLQLHNNQLSGVIPEAIGALEQLQYLYLQNNQLTGSIPSGIGSLSQAINLYVHNNGLSGMLPSSLSNLVGLNRLFLENNDLEGCIPTEWLSLCDSVDVRIQGNQCLSHDSDWDTFCLNPQCSFTIEQCQDCENIECIELCDNGIDDDLDGLVDCADDDCDSFNICLQCGDGEMNGDEEGIDCGGSCQPCVPELTISAYDLNVFGGPGELFNIQYTILSNVFLSAPVRVAAYLSDDDTFDIGEDLLIEEIIHQQFDGTPRDIVPSYGFENSEAFESSIPVTTAGVKYVFLVVDSDDAIDEQDDFNNSDLAYSFTSLEGHCYDGVISGDETDIDCGGSCPVCPPSCTDGIQNGTETGVDCGGNCDPCQTVDYQLSNLSISTLYEDSISYVPGAGIALSYDITNLSIPPVTDSAEIHYYLSDNDLFEIDTDSRIGVTSISIPSDATNLTFQDSLLLPVLLESNSYYLFAVVNHVEDEILFNNISQQQLVTKPAYCCDNVMNGEETAVDCGRYCPPCNQGPTISVNSGFSDGTVFQHNVRHNLVIRGNFEYYIGYCDKSLDYGIYLSTDQEYNDEEDIELLYINEQSIGNLGFSYIGLPQHFRFGTNIDPGIYYIIFVVDISDAYDENDEDDNVAVTQIEIISEGTCDDGILNQNEIDIDCGGSCDPCIEICDNNIDDDEDGLVDCNDDDCDDSLSCPTCFDGVMNGDEEGVDCGGSCDPCIAIDFIANSFSVGGSGTYFRGQTVSGSANFTIANLTSENTKIAIYLSDDDQWDAGDGSPIKQSTYAFSSIGTRNMTISNIVLPFDVSIGDYYLIYRLDPGNEYDEAFEDNNFASFPITLLQETCSDGIQNQLEEGIDCGGPNCAPCASIDFIANSFSIGGSGAYFRGQTVSGSANFTIANQSSESTKIAIYLSDDDQWDVSDGSPIKQSTYAFSSIGTRNMTISNIVLPSDISVGDYYLIYRLDPGNEYDEAFEDNNFASFPITFLQETCSDGIQNQLEEGIDCGGPNCSPCLPIDFVANSFSIGGSGTYFRGQTVSGSANFTIANQSSQSTKIAIYLSDDDQWDVSDGSPIKQSTYAFSSIGTRNMTISNIVLPSDISIGDYYLIYRIDPGNEYDESFEDNNTIPFAISITDYPDLLIEDILLETDTWTSGQSVTTTTQISRDEIPVEESFRLSFFISSDPTYDTGVDAEIASVEAIIPIDELGEIVNYTIEIPEGLELGQFYLIGFVDSENNINEGPFNEDNNTFNVLINVQEASCSDGIQNGGETDIDCGGVCEPCPEICDNGLDDDGDGLIDCLDDDCPECAVEVCDNGVDDDGDGLIDCEDDECDEAIACVSCSDGIKNGDEEQTDCGGSCDPCACPENPDQAALMAIYNATGGDSWTNNTGWGPDTCNVCSWSGVVCDEMNRVSELRLINNNLVGMLPEAIGELNHLTTLVISDNPELTGPIPESISLLTSLEHLVLSGNSLSGEIPSSIASLSMLRTLKLNGNILTGAIPPALGDLSSLVEMRLDNNSLTGEIPVELGGMSQLLKLYLSENNLEGCIPSSFSGYCGNSLVILHCNPCLAYDEGVGFGSFCAGDPCVPSTNAECSTATEVMDEMAEARSITTKNNTDELRIYPNPVTDRIIIEAQSATGEYPGIMLLDMSGRILLSEQITSSYHKVDISPHPLGTYILMVSYSDQIITEKIVKLN